MPLHGGDYRSLIRSSIMKKIVNPSLDIDNEKRIVNDLITQNHSVEYKFKIEVAIPIHLPPNSKPGTCKKVVDMVKEQ